MFSGSQSLGRLLRAHLAATALAASVACGGTITFGNDPEEVPLADGGVMTIVDSSVVTPPPDGGAGCTPGVRPAQPLTWPYPATAAAYQQHFLSTLPAVALNCDNPACHNNNVNVPFIPSAALLADPANATRAINELWLRARPPVAGQPALRRKHAADGDAFPQVFTAEQLAAVQAFIDKAYDCAWKTAPAPGPNECPRPDTTHCDQ